MRLLTFREEGRLRPALLLGGTVVRPVSHACGWPVTMRELIRELERNPGCLASLPATTPDTRTTCSARDLEGSMDRHRRRAPGSSIARDRV
jgi:hypothetical protein